MAQVELNNTYINIGATAVKNYEQKKTLRLPVS